MEKLLSKVEHGNQWENIQVDVSNLDNWTLHNAIVELEETEPEMKNIPRLAHDWQQSFSGKIEHVEIIKLGDWSIKCYSDRLKIAQEYFHTVSIPPIAYSDIVSISFDTYIDSSKLVAIWIDLKDGGKYTVSTVSSI